MNIKDGLAAQICHSFLMLCRDSILIEIVGGLGGVNVAHCVSQFSSCKGMPTVISDGGEYLKDN